MHSSFTFPLQSFFRLAVICLILFNFLTPPTNAQSSPPLKTKSTLKNSKFDNWYWENLGFKGAKVVSLKEKELYPLKISEALTKKTDYQIDLTAIMFTGSSWTQDRATEHFKVMARIFLQCNVLINEITLVVTPFPKGRVWSGGNSYSNIRDLEEQLTYITQYIETPQIFLVDQVSINLNIYSFYFDYNAFLRRQIEIETRTGKRPISNPDTDKPIFDTIWVHEKIASPTYSDKLYTDSKSDIPYDPISHHLFHILTSDEDHFFLIEKNLMGDYQSGKLQDKQCADLRSSTYLKVK